MKLRTFSFFSLFLVLLFLSACSNNPKLELLHSSAEISFNIFNDDDPGYHDSGLGHGHTFTNLKPNQEGVFTLNYILGSSKQNSAVPLLPSAEKLIQLEQETMNAKLIITHDENEVARFNLDE